MQVNALQDALANLDYAVGAKDGIFGGFTRAAVLAFQADNGLDTTGVVDRSTWEALSTAPPRPLSRARTNIAQEELAKLGSTTIIDALRTKNLGWVSAILGVLGLTSVAGSAAGAGPAAAAGPLEPIVRELLPVVAGSYQASPAPYWPSAPALPCTISAGASPRPGRWTTASDRISPARMPQ